MKEALTEGLRELHQIAIDLKPFARERMLLDQLAELRAKQGQ